MSTPFARIANSSARHFTHRGINCMTQMGPYNINGYIELPENHPWLNEGNLQEFGDVDVHGGITYHEGRIIGFDTNHYLDGQHPEAEHALQMPGITCGPGVHIWTWEEVETETRRLADQAKDTTNE